ncbi:MAG: hypothetical protein KC457_07245 [Myxococcales bacterium]|nr:hypothetical protein [Myxococcales bacterium]
MHLIQTIEEAFSEVERPDDRNYTTSKGEAYEEASEYFGRTREELSPEFLEQNRGVIFWFTPEAFLYYLPAFLRASVETDDEDALYIHSFLFLLRPNDQEDFARARWGLLNDKQVTALREWLEWLRDKASNDKILRNEAEEALEAIDARLWWD